MGFRIEINVKEISQVDANHSEWIDFTNRAVIDKPVKVHVTWFSHRIAVEPAASDGEVEAAAVVVERRSGDDGLRGESMRELVGAAAFADERFAEGRILVVCRKTARVVQILGNVAAAVERRVERPFRVRDGEQPTDASGAAERFRNVDTPEVHGARDRAADCGFLETDDVVEPEEPRRFAAGDRARNKAAGRVVAEGDRPRGAVCRDAAL